MSIDNKKQNFVDNLLRKVSAARLSPALIHPTLLSSPPRTPTHGTNFLWCINGEDALSANTGPRQVQGNQSPPAGLYENNDYCRNKISGPTLSPVAVMQQNGPLAQRNLGLEVGDTKFCQSSNWTKLNSCPSGSLR